MMAYNYVYLTLASDNQTSSSGIQGTALVCCADTQERRTSIYMQNKSAFKPQIILHHKNIMIKVCAKIFKTSESH